MFRAFRHRNFRLFFGGQIVSLIGNWMSTTATSWLVYRLTGSAFMLGVVNFAGQIPAFVLAPLAGTYVDRWNRHHLLIGAQATSMVQFLVLAVLTLAGQITVPTVIVLSVVQGVVNAFEMPCRQAFVLTLVEDKKDLSNAIALNSSMFNGARLIGPAIAGGLIAAAGEGWCFLIGGVSYLAVIVALLLMRLTSHLTEGGRHLGALEQFREGLRYVFGFGPMRSIILLLGLVSLVGIPYSVLMPVFANEILGGGPGTLGLLLTASGGGALLAALLLAARRSVRGLARMIPVAAGLFGIALVAFSFSRSLWLSTAILVVAGFGVILQMASSNTLLQTIVDDEKRGRVMSFYTMAYLGTVPVGSLLAGALSGRIGAPSTVRLGGLCAIAGAVWFAKGLPQIREAIRPIYVRMGIIPELATGVQSATQLTTPPED